MLHMPNHMLLGGQAATPPGQVLFTSSTTWTVPDGIYSICVVCIGPGEGAPDTLNSGGGGALRYFNSVAVTPGETLSIGLSTSSSTTTGGARLYRGSTNLCRANAGGRSTTGNIGTGFNGGGGESKNTGESRPGGGAGGYTSAGTSLDVDTGGGGEGSDPYGRRLRGGYADQSTKPYPAGGDYGGGGGLFYNGSTNTLGAGGLGCVRIIWGPGRAFPNINTEDV